MWFSPGPHTLEARDWQVQDEVFAMERCGAVSSPPFGLSPPAAPDWEACWVPPKGFRSIKRSLSEDSLYSQESFYEYDLKHWCKNSTASYEAALISEAHGLITDMLADSNLPPHVVGGLRTVSNLLKPPDTHVPGHKPKVSPLVSLAETTNYGSDTEDLPYTGERPSSLPKRLRRSLPPSLIRRMSTSTWTTTTSATGMPTLEAEPCRTRSSSFRHSRDNTPGSSPAASRSNSPSPSSPTTVSLIIPKSRSFSLASPGACAATTSALKQRASRERRSLQHGLPCASSSASGSGSGDAAGLLSPLSATSEKSFPVTAAASPATEERAKNANSATSGCGTATSGSGVAPGPAPRRLNITSDYESSDSPGNSDHSDNVTGVDGDDVTASGPRSPANRRKVTLSGLLTTIDSDGRASQLQTQPDSSEQGSSTETTESIGSTNTIDSVSSPTRPDCRPPIPTVSLQAQSSVDSRADLLRDYDDQGGEKAGDTSLSLPYDLDVISDNDMINTNLLNQWDYPIFELADRYTDTVLSQVSYKIFMETGLFETFRIPLPEFLNYFHALELGYREKPYHNRVHATDVLHGVYYLTTQPIPGFEQVNPNGTELLCKQGASSSESDSELSEKATVHRPSFTAEETYGIMGGNFPALELMALYTAAAMHDYDHPGRTNAFLVTTHSSLAILYNDRSVLESHHAASAWELLLSSPAYNWLCQLEKGEFKRFRFLVIEAVLATDLKRHFEMVAEFNAKVNDDDAPGIDWTNESDRLLSSNMVIKLADINGPTKQKDLHVDWTTRITEEFYEQGDEEASMGMTISPYMDRNNPQLAKLQESFINHLVAPLLNCLGAAGLLPGSWVEDEDLEDDDSDKEDSSAYKDTEDEETDQDNAKSTETATRRSKKRIHCWLTKNLEENHAMWVAVIKREAGVKERETGSVQPPPRSPREADTQCTHLEPIQLPQRSMSVSDKEMESIKEEDTPPNSANSLKEEDQRRASLPALRHSEQHSVTFAQPAVVQPVSHEPRQQQPLVSCLSPSSKKHDTTYRWSATQRASQQASQPSQPTSQQVSQPMSQSKLPSEPQPMSQPTSEAASQLVSQSTQPTSEPMTQPTSQTVSQSTSQSASQPMSQITSQPRPQTVLQPMSQLGSQPKSQPMSQPASQPMSSQSSQPVAQQTSQIQRTPAEDGSQLHASLSSTDKKDSTDAAKSASSVPSRPTEVMTVTTQQTNSQ